MKLRYSLSSSGLVNLSYMLLNGFSKCNWSSILPLLQISDFGLAKWLPEKWTHHVVFPIEGTFGLVRSFNCWSVMIANFHLS